MGWQDAPLASPTGPKPAWSSAPLATQSNAPAGGAVPEDPRGPTVGGFLSRVRAHVQQSIGSLAGGIDQVGSDLTGSDWFKHDQAGADQHVREAQDVLANTPTVSTDTHPVLGRAAKYGEQALGMVPDLALAANPVGLGLYALGTEGDTARRRAMNDQRAGPSIMDYIAAAPSSAANVALQRFGVGGKGASLLQRIGREGAAQAGIAGADYTGTTAGTKTPFSFSDLGNQAAEGAATGIVLGGGMHVTGHGLAALRGRYATKGVDTSGISDEQLTEGTLNGSIHPDVGPADLNEIIQSQGLPPESVSPEKQAPFAARINAARNRPSTNDLGAAEIARQNGIAEDVAAGDTHPAWMSAPVERTPSPDVTMTAAPEGLIRSDDAGAQVGVDRHRAASENVLATAQQHADRDPVVREILDSSLSPDTKVGVLLDRLHKYIGSLPDTPKPPPLTDQAPTPFQEPTPEAARNHRLEPASQLERELAVTKHTESHGDPNAVSPKGARGTMQTMPGTLRDPGYGVRPAANDSPAELERVGRDYYAALRAHYGSADKAWAAYNAGPGALDGAVSKYGAAWLDHMPEETRNYVRKNLNAVGGERAETVYRGPAPTEDPFRSDSGFERTSADESPTNAQREAGAPYENMATGDSSRPFMEETDTPAGEAPGYWERRAEMHAEDLRKEWEASKQSTGEASGDPSQRYGANNYGQRPHMPEGSDAFAMTTEGHIADVNGKPVAFRNVKDAARFAAKNKLGGDFEPQVWATNSARVVLTKRAGSSYGERPAQPEGPAEPPSGRSEDTAQRLIPDWQKAPVEPAGERSAPEAGSPPFADSGSISDRAVPRETENVPAKDVPPPRNFFQVVRDYLAGEQTKTGVRTRLSAEDAISNGVTPDSIYIDPKAKYPRLKIWASKVFANKNGPLMSQAKPTRIVSLDHLGDRFDPERFGVPPGDGLQEHRLSTEHAGDLLQQSIDGHPDAFDRTDERYQPHMAQHEDSIASGREEQDREHIRDIALQHGVELSEDDVNAAMHHLADGLSHGEAVEASVRESGARALDRAFDETGDEFYRSASHDVHEGEFPEQRGESSEEGVDRPASEFGDANRGSAGSEEPASPELVPERETDQRDRNQRRADERLRPRLEQKSPGSDGGLFDTQDTTGDLYGADAPPKAATSGKPVKTVKEAKKALGDPHRDSSVAAEMERGWNDGKAGNVDALAAEVAKSKKSAEGVRGDGSGTFNPRQSYLEAYHAAVTGRAVEVRAKGGFRDVLGPDDVVPGGSARPDGDYGANNKLVTREDYEKAGQRITDASKRAHSGVDPEAVGALATEAAFHVEAAARKLASMVMEPDANPAEILHAVRDMVKQPLKTTKGLLKALDRFGSAVAYSSDGALRTLARHYDSPTIVKLADMFQARAGAADATGETYDGALKRNNGRFRSRLDETLDPFIGNKAAMERIRDLLADPGRVVRSTDKERAAAREVRNLLKDVIDYRKEAGEEIGAVKNYFPRVVDSLAVANNPGKFKAAAERLYRELGVDDPAAAADAWMQRILDTHAGLDGGEEFLVNSGKPSSSKNREFGPAADRLLRDFMQKDPLLVLSDYITGSVRRAEQTRRFGHKGAENSKERGEWMKEHGSKTQWDVMLDKIREELRASGEDADGIVRQVKMIRDGSMGRLGTAGVRVSRAVSTIHAWNQLSTLQNVTLSSIGDLAMGFIAGKGGMVQGTRHFTTSLKETARLVETLGKRDLSDAHRWAEAIGVVGHGTASQLIQARMDAAPGAVRHANLLNKFYHKVGIEQLTQGGRIAAAENAKVFLDTLSGDLLSGSARTRQRATFFLKELGIKDPAPFAEWVRNNGTPDRQAVQRAAEGSREAEYAAAVVRFADQTVLMPSRAMKPAWANHPVGSLLFALQSYNAAFTQNVLKRVGRLGVEAVKTKDPHLLVPALGLTVIVAMNALQDYLRKALFGGANADETEQQYAFRILDRSGLTGMASPLFNAMFGLKYHRSVSQSLQGSVIGRAGQAIDAGGGLFIGNSDKSNAAERKAAGLLYDLVIDPATNAFGAKYVRGAAGTAVIMGTGNKKGGVLPADKEAFVSAVAGPGKT